MATFQKVNWEHKTLSQLGFIGRGKSKHRPRDDVMLYGGEYPFVQTSDIKHANFYVNSFSQTYNEAGLKQSKLWEKDTLCMTIAANIAETALLSFPACFPDSIVGFVADPKKSNVKFIKYALDLAKKDFQKTAKGTAQDNLSLEKIDNLKISVPDPKTQTRIASVLSAYDELIENNEKRIKALEEMAQLLYNEWFVKFKFPGHEKVKMVDSGTEYGMIPNGWNVNIVEYLIKRIPVGKKYENKNVFETGKVPVLDQGKTGYIGFHNDEPGVKASIENPVIVFANHTCYQNIIVYPFSAIQNVLPFVPKDERDIFWLHWATKDLIKFNDYKGHWPEFMSKKLIVPNIELTKKFGIIVDKYVAMKYKLESENKTLSKTRDLLIPQLITGKRELK